MPKLSIITVNYNNGDGLCATIRSILQQDFRDYELIVVDGGSTDMSLQMLRSLEGRAQIVSEPDEGPYDAMNKGLARACGNWVVFMNSGDCFFRPDTVATCMAAPLQAVDLAYGRTADRQTRKVMPYKPIERIHEGNAFSHQSVFFRREMHLAHPYDTRLRISADFKVVLSMIKAGARVGRLDTVVAAIDYGGISSSVEDRHRERDGVSAEIAGGAPLPVSLADLAVPA